VAMVVAEWAALEPRSEAAESTVQVAPHRQRHTPRSLDLQLVAVGSCRHSRVVSILRSAALVACSREPAVRWASWSNHSVLTASRTAAVRWLLRRAASRRTCFRLRRQYHLRTVAHRRHSPRVQEGLHRQVVSAASLAARRCFHCHRWVVWATITIRYRPCTEVSEASVAWAVSVVSAAWVA